MRLNSFQWQQMFCDPLWNGIKQELQHPRWHRAVPWQPYSSDQCCQIVVGHQQWMAPSYTILPTPTAGPGSLKHWASHQDLPTCHRMPSSRFWPCQVVSNYLQAQSLTPFHGPVYCPWDGALQMAYLQCCLCSCCNHQQAEEWKSTLHRLCNEAYKAWKDANRVIFHICWSMTPSLLTFSTLQRMLSRTSMMRSGSAFTTLWKQQTILPRLVYPWCYRLWIGVQHSLGPLLPCGDPHHVCLWPRAIWAPFLGSCRRWGSPTGQPHQGHQPLVL